MDTIYVNSTGDGMLCVFIDPERHFMDAYLSGLIMFHSLQRLCKQYNESKSSSLKEVSFGIGIDSGLVWNVTSSVKTNSGPLIQTYLGNCINIAARAEAATKLYARTHIIIAESINWHLCQKLFNKDYRQLMTRGMTDSISDEDRKKAWDEMNRLNEQLLVLYSGHHNLNGVNEPVPLFRISEVLANMIRPEFIKLMSCLAFDKTHEKDILCFLKKI